MWIKLCRKWRTPFAFLAISIVCLYFSIAAFLVSCKFRDKNLPKDVITKNSWQNQRSLQVLPSLRKNKDDKNKPVLSANGQEGRKENELGPRVTITLDQFRKGHKTGNPIIDTYGLPGHELTAGGVGRGVVQTQADAAEIDAIMAEYKVNTLISDLIPLNRVIPDSRIHG
ncbi:hypothetical protein PoB_003172500 [Plakobranchus ocellatus]|uniref:Uncharacterized protein n=1 Tax=Plakobranchus ocellatus TaxID=259542 RepID=A0AAV4AEN5_9GAST|nr:hypothetical protein PoB_003172500 [Plakobranchus ocellatus]